MFSASILFACIGQYGVNNCSFDNISELLIRLIYCH